ncbi:hypothetical protein GQ457_12G023010 [Hibiscus cannabinus]
MPALFVMPPPTAIPPGIPMPTFFMKPPPAAIPPERPMPTFFMMSSPEGITPGRQLTETRRRGMKTHRPLPNILITVACVLVCAVWPTLVKPEWLDEFHSLPFRDWLVSNLKDSSKFGVSGEIDSRRVDYALFIVIREMLGRDWKIDLAYVPREFNTVDDRITSTMCGEPVGDLFFEVMPFFVSETVAS